MNPEFFERSPEAVARELLGKIIVRKIGNRELRSKIVETEAYFDERDPASRACKKGDLRETMKMRAGTILVFGVHNNWLLNFVTGFEGEASAVLIRALEPLNFQGRCCGPGLLTKALKIGKKFHKRNINNKEIWLLDDKKRDFEIIKGFRIGVSKDLKKPLRFYIEGNKYVSRK